jgi:t-SNARE complex subunit (syntaxin)
LEIERQGLLDKQGRSRQYRSKAERDAYLNKEIKSVKESIVHNQKQIGTLTKEIQESQTKLKDVHNSIENCDTNMDNLRDEVVEATKDVEENRLERGRLDERRKYFIFVVFLIYIHVVVLLGSCGVKSSDAMLLWNQLLKISAKWKEPCPPPWIE